MQYRAQQAIDDTFAEDLVVVPRAKGINSSSTEDTTRPAFNAKGIFRNISLDLRTGEESGPRDTANPVVSIVQSLLNYEPVAGDIIYRIASRVAYEITGIEPQGMARVRIDLVALEDETV